MNERDLRRINGGSNNLKSLSCNEKQNNDLRQINSPIEPEKLILKVRKFIKNFISKLCFFFMLFSLRIQFVLQFSVRFF